MVRVGAWRLSFQIYTDENVCTPAPATLTSTPTGNRIASAAAAFAFAQHGGAGVLRAGLGWPPSAVLAGLTKGRVTRAWSDVSTPTGGVEAVSTDTRYAYNSLSRLDTVTVHALASVTLSAPQATTYQYDEQGRTTQVANAQGIINYAYNDLGQQIRTWTSTPGSSDSTDAVTDTRYSYDSLGRLSTVAVYERMNAYAPGARSEATTPEELTTYHYDAVGNLDYLVTAAMDGTNPSGAITTDYVYDSLNRLDLLTHFVDADGRPGFHSVFSSHSSRRRGRVAVESGVAGVQRRC